MPITHQELTQQLNTARLEITGLRIIIASLADALNECVIEISAYYDAINNENAETNEALNKAAAALELVKGLDL